MVRGGRLKKGVGSRRGQKETIKEQETKSLSAMKIGKKKKEKRTALLSERAGKKKLGTTRTSKKTNQQHS